MTLDCFQAPLRYNGLPRKHFGRRGPGTPPGKRVECRRFLHSGSVLPAASHRPFAGDVHRDRERAVFRRPRHLPIGGRTRSTRKDGNAHCIVCLKRRKKSGGGWAPGLTGNPAFLIYSLRAGIVKTSPRAKSQFQAAFCTPLVIVKIPWWRPRHNLQLGRGIDAQGRQDGRREISDSHVSPLQLVPKRFRPGKPT